MTLLRKTQPYFVRCIKPNHEQIPNHLIDQFVLKQLQYSGMLETVRIRRQGYPVRFAFQDFVDRFQFLLAPAERKLLAQKGKGGCADIIKLIGLAPGDCVYGKSKIFFKDKPASFMEARLAQIQAERMQKLLAEIERKKREEQERLEAERRAKEEEERRLEAERRAKEEERKAKEAALRAREDEEEREKAQREANKARKKQEEEQREEEMQLTRVLVKFDEVPLPSMVKIQGDQGPLLLDELMEASSESDLTDSEEEAEAALLPPPPPPIPSDYYSKEEVVRRMAQGPGWMEERKLKKVTFLHTNQRKLDADNVLVSLTDVASISRPRCLQTQGGGCSRPQEGRGGCSLEVAALEGQSLCLFFSDFPFFFPRINSFLFFFLFSFRHSANWSRNKRKRRSKPGGQSGRRSAGHKGKQQEERLESSFFLSFSFLLLSLHCLTFLLPFSFTEIKEAQGFQEAVPQSFCDTLDDGLTYHPHKLHLPAQQPQHTPGYSSSYCCITLHHWKEIS